jgi:hypothetical protein
MSSTAQSGHWMLGDALAFPTRSSDWIGTALVGALLTLGGLLILPAVVVQGYMVRVMAAAARGDDAPSFTDWGGLFVDGLKLLVVALVYGLVAFVPMVAVAVVLGTGAALAGSEAIAGIAGLGGLAFGGLGLLAVAYLVPAAAANLAIEGRLGAAFALGTVLRGALSLRYALAWLAAAVVSLVGSLVGTPLVLVLVGFVVLFYAQVVTFYLYGRGFAEGRSA